MNRRGLRTLTVVTVGILATLVTAVALASWSTTGNGTGSGSVGTLSAPASVSVSSVSNAVTANWAGVTPPDGVLTGYYVTRYQGATPSNACGTVPGTPATYIASGTTTCLDNSVPDGTYTYTVTAVFRTWTAESPSSNVVTVVTDPSLPSQTITLAPTPSNAYLGGATLYFRSATSGSFRFSAAVSDAVSGPASATFPAIATSGWTHANETVTSGTGTNPITYTSSVYSWTPAAATPAGHTITGRDHANNTVNTTINFAADNSAPTGGSLTVNGIAATGAGSTSTANVAFPINTRVDYAADTGSGVASSVLTRSSATLTNGVCGTYGAATVIAGNPNQTGLATGCYRFTLTGTDNVGNGTSVSTVVRYDATAPTTSVSLTAGVGAAMTGTNIYVRTNFAGSFVLNAAVTDANIGPASASFPAVTTAGWTHPTQTVSIGTGSAPTITYPSSTYSWTAGAGRPGNTTITGTDSAGNTGTSVLAFVRDNAAPNGGALRANGTNATVAGSTSFDRTGSFTLTRTDYTDALSGITSSILVRESATLVGNTCGAFGSAVTLTGAPAQSGLTSGCYRYTLTGTDRVGNVASRSTTVKVDLVVPAAGALTVNGVAASAAGTTSTSNAPTFAIDSRTDWTDAESGLAGSVLTRAQATLTSGTCGTYGATTTLVGTPAQTGLTTGCYRYQLVGTDNAGNTSTITTVVRYDVTVPAGGALTVNGVAASGAGTTSTINGPSFTIGTRTDFTDAATGIASSLLTRESATLTGTTCGTFGAPTTLTGNPTQAGLATGCYRYRLTGTDNAGNTASLTTIVSVRLYLSAAQMVNGGPIAGRVDAGDTFSLTFSDTVAVNTLCSTWSGDGSNQTLNADNQVTVRLNNGGAANDTITVTTTGCTLNLGSINLGSTAYTTANVTFGGAGANRSTVAWNAATRTLTVTLGAVSGAGAATVASSSPVVTPSTTVTNPNGVTVGGTFTLPAGQKF